MAHDDTLKYFACALPVLWKTSSYSGVAVQLRDLVPPQSQAAISADKDESKRPKHVVLSDTIALVKELRVKVIYLVKQMALQAYALSHRTKA